MSKKQPNLIYIFADQWRKQAAGFMKEDQVMTPNIDRFSEDNLVLRNAVSSFPLCTPHRGALLTGKQPLSTGLFTNCKNGCDIMLSPDEICISDVLKESGYDTGYIGKLHLDVPEQNHCENPLSGAKNWDAFTPPGPKRHGFDFWYSYGAYDNHLAPHYWRDTHEMIKVNQWSPEHETDVAIEYIKNHGSEKPFALFISWNPPHSPYDLVPQKYKDMYKDKNIEFRPNVCADKLVCHTEEDMGGGTEKLTQLLKDYFAAVTGLDDNFGRILETIKENGIEDDTVVVLSSDHGDMLGSHGMLAKHVWYEESIGIPFILRWPEKLKKGYEDTILESADMMPTILGLMNLDIPETVEGKDISDILLGAASDMEKSAYICACPGRDVFLKEFAEYGADPRAFGWRGIRTQRYTYVINRGYHPGEKLERLLYDNEIDPYQKNVVAIKDIDKHPLAKELEQELLQKMDEYNDLFIRNGLYL